MPTRSTWYLPILLVLVCRATTVGAADRALHVDLVATLMTQSSSSEQIHISDLLTDEQWDGSQSTNACLEGPNAARILLSYTKGARDEIMVTGEVQLVEQACRDGLTLRLSPEPSVRQAISRTVPSGVSVPEVINMQGASGARLTGLLTIRNWLPSCTSTHVRWRTHMDFTDPAGRTEAFDSRQVSALLERNEAFYVGSGHVVEDRSRGTVVSSMDVSEGHVLNVQSMLQFFELPGTAPTPDATASEQTSIPPGPARVVALTAGVRGRVVATTTIENRGQPRCTAPYSVVEVPSGFWVPRQQAGSSCANITRGCYSEKSGTGWVRIDDVTCTGKGSARRCRIQGAGRGLVCPGSRWTFDAGSVDADCGGALLPVSCLASDAAVLRFTPTGLTIRRESRMDERNLRLGGTCQ